MRIKDISINTIIPAFMGAANASGVVLFGQEAIKNNDPNLAILAVAHFLAATAMVFATKYEYNKDKNFQNFLTTFESK